MEIILFFNFRVEISWSDQGYTGLYHNCDVANKRLSEHFN